MKIIFLNNFIYRDYEQKGFPVVFDYLPRFPKRFIKEIEEGESCSVSVIGFKYKPNFVRIKMKEENMYQVKRSSELYEISIFLLYFGVKIQIAPTRY